MTCGSHVSGQRDRVAARARSGRDLGQDEFGACRRIVHGVQRLAEQGRDGRAARGFGHVCRLGFRSGAVVTCHADPGHGPRERRAWDGGSSAGSPSASPPQPGAAARGRCAQRHRRPHGHHPAVAAHRGRHDPGSIGSAGTILLSSNADSRLPGEYSFWFTRRHRACPLGEIVATTPTTVTRRILGVDFGDLAAARSAAALTRVVLSEPPTISACRSASRRSRRRSVPRPPGCSRRGRTAARSAGRSTCTAAPCAGRRRCARSDLPRGRVHLPDVSYRNDGEAPRSDDYRYALGDREWLDVEPAMRYAIGHGAEELVLVGLVDGRRDRSAGAHPLAALRQGDRRRSSNRRSSTGSRPSTSRRDAPLPAVVRWCACSFSGTVGRLFTGLAEPLDLDRLDFVRRARELDRPVLSSTATTTDSCRPPHPVPWPSPGPTS